jgi:Ni/Co efflux regulator RcnB
MRKTEMTRLLPTLLVGLFALTPLAASAQDKKAEMKAEPAKTTEAQKDEPKKAAEKKPAAKKTEAVKDEKKKPKRGSC